MELSEHEQSVEENEFEVMTAAEWLGQTGFVEPKMLFGELWSEGEISVMYGETSSSKSVLAVQIGESIASGKSIKPFAMTAEAQKVLLLDLGGTREQFARRYTSEADDENPAKPYEFSPNLIRVSLKGPVQTAPAKLAAVIERTGAAMHPAMKPPTRT